METRKIGFIGAGGIARAHAFALQAQKYYYPGSPRIRFSAVTSRSEESRSAFANKFGFKGSPAFNDFIKDPNLDTILILGPNNMHMSHLEAVMKMENVQNIYIEKPLCVSQEEEEKARELLSQKSSGVKIQTGFQFLQSSAIREALAWWKENDLGEVVHFSFTYRHSDYLKQSYREKRRSRLIPAPAGGAMADLGSHALSLMVAFLGNDLMLTGAVQSGSFEDVPEGSDLYAEISLYDPKSKAAGNLSASRISSGIGDMLAFEIFTTKGALKYNSLNPDRFEYYLEDKDHWSTVFTNSNYKPITSFPAGYVPGGWLRSLIHAHYIFLTGDDEKAFIPDLEHGLEVQRFLRESADAMNQFRINRTNI